GTSVASSSQAWLALQMCSSPQSVQRIRPATSGNRLNTEGSVSISVETARPVRGQRIITAPMAPLPDPQTGSLLPDGGDTAKAGKRQPRRAVDAVDNFFHIFLRNPGTAWRRARWALVITKSPDGSPP